MGLDTPRQADIPTGAEIAPRPGGMPWQLDDLRHQARTHLIDVVEPLGSRRIHCRLHESDGVPTLRCWDADRAGPTLAVICIPDDSDGKRIAFGFDGGDGQIVVAVDRPLEAAERIAKAIRMAERLPPSFSRLAPNVASALAIRCRPRLGFAGGAEHRSSNNK
jgi:hypothetical protein